MSPRYAQSWRWEEDGPEVAGVVVERRIVDLRGKSHEVLEIETLERGNVAVWCTSAGLARWVESDSPEPGDSVTIKRLGTELIFDKKTGLPFIPSGNDGQQAYRVLWECSVDSRTSLGDIPDRRSELQPPGPGYGEGGEPEDDDLPF